MTTTKTGIGIALFALTNVASATVLSFAGTADDAYTASLSTISTAAGTTFSSGSAWYTTTTGSITLTPGVTNYLQVAAKDLYGAPSMFIASMSLSDTDFAFGNGTQSLVTNASDWTASLVGFGGTSVAVTDLGIRGTSPWGNVSGIDPSAHFIWTDGPLNDVRYFTIAITPKAVPEPITFSVLGFGLLALRRRTRVKN